MPIKIPDSLPACTVLEEEHIFVMTEYRALHQDIRPLRIAILNLMPTKIATETQLLRCLANTPLQIEVELIQTASHAAKNTPQEHLLAYYKSFEEIKNRHFDGMIITGAPVESMPFEEVDYWEELCKIMEWTKTNVHSTLHLCWGAQAALYYHYKVRKHPLPEKKSGIFVHTLENSKARLFRGFDEEFYAPHSRHTEIRPEEILRVPELKLLSTSKEAGVYIVGDQDGSQFFVTGHPEYDADTLGREYRRDLEAGLKPKIPAHYYEKDDPTCQPVNRWRAHGHLLYTNWLNYYVYQTTPFDIDHKVREAEAYHDEI